MAKEDAKDILYRDEKKLKEEKEYRNSLLGELKDKLTPAQILYSSTDKLENIKNELNFKNKNKSNENLINYDDIENDKTLSKQEKIEKLKERKTSIDKEITKQGNIEKGKKIGLGALEIGAMALPQTKAMKVGAKVGEAVLKKYTGKAVGKALGEGVASGAVSGGVSGAVDAVKNKDDVVKGAAKGVVGGAVAGGVVGGVGSGVEKVVSGKVLERAQDIKVGDSEMKRRFRKNAQKYYQDYIQHTKTKNKDIGEVEFSGKGIKETLNKDIETGKNIPKLKKNIKNAKKTETNELYKERKDKIKKFHTLENDKEKYIIAQDENRQRYYMSKAKENTTEAEKQPNILERAKEVLYKLKRPE